MNVEIHVQSVTSFDTKNESKQIYEKQTIE